MVDFNTYQPPGVYVEEEASALVSVGGIAPSVVALVGPSVGYRIATESVTLSGTTSVTLSNKGVISSTGFRVTSLSGGTFDPSDYSLSIEAGADGDILATTDNITTIVRSADSQIGDGETIYVSYRYADASYYQPVKAHDLDDVVNAFGPALDLATNAVVSPLSLAAKFAFDNGASTLVLVATKGGNASTTVAELTAAYATLNGVPEANIIVPLPVGIGGTDAQPGEASSVGSALATYVENQAVNGNLRIGIVGMETSVSIDPGNLVAGYSSKRIVHAHPHRVLYYNGATNSTIEVAGYYLAAAYAGRFASLPVQTPLTKKAIRGFSGIPASLLSGMTSEKKNTWSSQGVAVTEITRQGGLVVRHGTSTDRSSVVNREISLVRARDALVTLLQETLDNSGLIGSYIEADTTTRIQGVIEGILETASSSEFIVGYSDVKVRQNGVTPSIIEVKFRYRPAYPLNYIVVSFSVNTETGSTDVLDITA